MKSAICTLFVTATVFAGAALAATTPWTPFAAGHLAIPAQAPTNFYAQNIHALAVRATEAGTVTWNITCEGSTTVKAGQVVRLPDVKHAKVCLVGQTVFDPASHDGPQPRVELLKAP